MASIADGYFNLSGESGSWRQRIVRRTDTIVPMFMTQRTLQARHPPSAKLDWRNSLHTHTLIVAMHTINSFHSMIEITLLMEWTLKLHFRCKRKWDVRKIVINYHNCGKFNLAISLEFSPMLVTSQTHTHRHEQSCCVESYSPLL